MPMSITPRSPAPGSSTSPPAISRSNFMAYLSSAGTQSALIPASLSGEPAVVAFRGENANRLAVRERRNVLDGVLVSALEKFLRCVTQVGRQHDVGQRTYRIRVGQRLAMVDVEARPGDAALAQHCMERLFFDERPAGGVDENR